MASKARSLHLVLLGAILLAFPLLAGAGEDDAQDALPLRKVLLFNSGVGYFEHRANVQGDQQVALTFNVDDVNDLLKSMVVQDLGGGRVAAVTYGSRDPVSRALQSFAIDLTGNLTLASLLEQVRGERVHLEIGVPVDGTIVSVETRPQRVGDEILQTSYLNVLTGEGLKSVPFDAIRSLRLLDERLDREMRQALEILSRGRDAQRKTVTLEFLGAGERPVRVGYVRATPVWKTSYRLVLDEESPEPFLQGWAIVENTTDQDWDGVDLTLVSGQPISYVMNLYQPLYAQRPVVEPQLPAGVRPQTYERELDDLRARLEKESQGAERARRPRGRSAEPARDAGMPAPAAAPAEGGFDIARGVEAAAAASELGELFQYRIKEPVHLPRQRSAMLPILNQRVQGEKVSIFDSSVHPKHPLNGLLLVNDTDVHIMQGPVTVFDGGAYAGDALMGDMPQGATRLLSYALDLEVEVAEEGRSKPDELISVKIVKGSLVTQHLRRRERTFVARNSDGKPRKLLVSYRLDPSWKLTRPDTAFEKTRNQYRFELDVAASSTEQLLVAEEQSVREEIGLTNLGSERIALYLRARQVSSAAKEALAEVVKRKQAIDELSAQYRDVERRVKEIGEEQSRIRQNMGQIDRASELYGRYLEKLGTQEDEIEKLGSRSKELSEEMRTKGQALAQWLLSLDID